MEHRPRNETEAENRHGLRLPEDRYRVGDLFLDIQRERVIRSGREIRLSKLTFDLLVALVRAAPDLVSVDALIERVWAGSIVGPETVSQRVKRLRLALGDDPKAPRYVGGVRGRGYRLIAPVSPWVAAAPGSKAGLGSEAAPDPEAAPARARARLSERWGAAIALVALALVVSAYAWIHARSAARAPPALTADAGAYQLYEQAGSVPISEPGLRRALVLLDGAIARDPGFARAIAARAEVRTGFAALGYPLANGLEDAELDARRALALQPHLTMADAVLGMTSAYRGDWPEADERFRAALDTLQPSAAFRSEYAVFVLESEGRVRQALAQAREAYRQAPTGQSEVVLLASVDSLMGRETEAEMLAGQALNLGYPATAAPLAEVLATTAQFQGRYAEAAERAVNSLPPAIRSAGGARAVRLVYSTLADPGRRPAARSALDGLLQSLEPGDIDVATAKDLISWLVKVGEVDSAYEVANRSLDSLARAGTVGSAWGMLWSPDMRPFRQDPRFEAFAGRLKLLDYWQRYGPPDDCNFDRGTLTCK